MRSVVGRAAATAIPANDCNKNPRQSVLIRGQQISVFSHELLNLTYDTIEFVDEIRMIAVLPKRGHKGSVTPNGAVFFSTDALKHFETMSSKLSENRTRVMHLIRR